MDLNLFGTVMPTQIFGQAIAEQKRGSTITFPSMALQRVITKAVGYSMAKTPIDAYTKWFAVEWANDTASVLF